MRVDGRDMGGMIGLCEDKSALIRKKEVAEYQPLPAIPSSHFCRDEAPTCIETEIYHFCYTFT